MSKKKSKKLTIVIIIAAFALYVFTKSYVRLLHFENEILLITIGSIPNFAAAITIPLALFIDFYKVKSIEELSKLNRKITISILIVTAVLVSEEFYPLFSGSRVFDLWDNVFSVTGISLALIYKSKIIQIIKREL